MSTDPENIAQGQLDAYNDHDLEKFCQFFAEDVKVFDAHTQDLLFEGMQAFRSRYQKTLSNPNLHCTLVNRMVQENIVIDQELVNGMGEDVVHAIAIYHIKDGQIYQVHFY